MAPAHRLPQPWRGYGDWLSINAITPPDLIGTVAADRAAREPRPRRATWGHHGQRGYRWHTLSSADRVVLHHSVQPANVHELAVAPALVQQAGQARRRPRFVIGDDGYDSEPLHRCVRASRPPRRAADRAAQRPRRHADDAPHAAAAVAGRARAGPAPRSPALTA